MSAVMLEANEIHPTCVISPDAKIGSGNYIGPYCIIGPHVAIGDGNRFVAHVCIGTPGQYRGKNSQGGVLIGDNNTFHEFSQVHQAMDMGANTTVGNNGYFMKGAHVAHDCRIGDSVTMCNDAALGGGTVVNDGATLGLLVTVHQEQEIGAYSMLGMGTVVPKQAVIEPGEIYAGNPARHIARNMVGLSRNKIPRHKLPSLGPRDAKTTVSAAQALAGTLVHYMETRSPTFRPKRLDILGEASKHIPYLSEDDAAQVYNMAFSLGWQQHEDFRADQTFLRELVVAPMGPVPPPDKPAHGKMAWLINHCALGTYAPFKHVIAYLSALPPCEVYVHGSVRKNEAQQLMAYGHNVTQFQGKPSHVADAVAERCKRDNIGVLISDIYTAVPLLTFQRRAAPLQVYLSPGFQLFPADLVLLPETQEEISYPNHKVDFIPTAVRMENLRANGATPGKGTFGVMSRPEKMSRTYLEAVDEITLRTGREFRIYGRGEPEYMGKHFTYHGVRNANKALGEIGVYLDTFPTCGGLSCFEAMAVGVPVITLDHPSVHSWNEFKPCVVKAPEDFVDAAIMAITDPGYAQSIATKGREIVASRIANTERAAGLLVKALERAGWQA